MTPRRRSPRPEFVRRPRRAYLRRGAPVPHDSLTRMLQSHLEALGSSEAVSSRSYNRAAKLEAEGAHEVEMALVLRWARSDWQEGRVWQDPFGPLRPSQFRRNLVLAEGWEENAKP